MAAVRGLPGAITVGTMVLLPAIAFSQTVSAPPALTLTAPLSAQMPLQQWAPFIAAASRRFGIPIAWISAVMRVESGGHTMLDGMPITSPAGAMGLMQLIPDTYAEMQSRYGLGPDPYDPYDSMLAGTAYLREMYLRYGYPNLFAAYNAGPGRFDEYLYDGMPLPPETSTYLVKLGHLEFAMPELQESSAQNAQISLGKNISLVPQMTAASAFNEPGMATLTPSSQGLFVPLDAGFGAGQQP